MRKIKIMIVGILLVLVILVSTILAQEADYCCEKTDYGAWCMNAPEENCGEGYKKAPTSCDATSYCREGCCYESQEGLCMENTPQRVCDDREGSWVDSAECDIPQCELGCCVLDSQAAFVTLTRCKRLSGFYGLETDFRLGINSEVECIAVTQLKDRGACVFEEEYTRTCKFTTREDCEQIRSTGNLTEPDFYKNYLCSADELATNCGPTTDTVCVPGKDEVYFIDTCGNPANIYDSSKTYDKDASYWKEVVGKAESCDFGDDNADDSSCGNCDYYLGSICKKSKLGNRATYGDYICEDLNCYDTSVGDKKHGESWCSYDGKTGEGVDSVGSRHYRHFCVAGEEIVEACADFRNEICIEGETETSVGVFQESACRVNRWKDCVEQKEKEDCENIARRDCFMMEGVPLVVSTGEEPSGAEELVEGACAPNVPPGFKFWEESETDGICNVASAGCTVTFEKGLFGSKKCEENCECLEEEWAQKRNQVCTSTGDCGGYVNWQGKFTGDGYDWKVDDDKRKLSQGIINSIRSRAGV